MTKIELILDGLKNYIIPNDSVRIISNQRAIICADCPFNRLNFCTECKCFIPVKILSIRDRCPKSKW